MRRSCRAALAAACAFLAALATPASAAGLDAFKDPVDGQFDLSGWLLERKGVLPVPIVITEPALGFGGGVAGLFFRKSGRERTDASGASRGPVPPDIYALGAMATENGTQGAFAGGMVSFDQDRYRWRGGVARTSVNLDFFGAGGRLPPIGYNLDGWVSVQQAMMRLADSDAWLVGRWNFIDLANRFDLEADAGQRFAGIERASRASGLGVSIEVDTRDNFFTPSRGWQGTFDATFYDPSWGSDTNFQAYRAHAFGYWPIGRSVVLGGRADLKTADGKVPFYLLPYVELRGVPLMRLQDRHAAVVEAEVRWNLDARWSLVGFAGAGRAWGSTTAAGSDGTDTVSKGVGFRYLLVRRLGLYAGVDWASSTQDHAWYLQVGAAWR